MASKKTLIVKSHMCWCDSCFCDCELDAVDATTGGKVFLRNSALLNSPYDIVWRGNTYASYIPVEHRKPS